MEINCIRVVDFETTGTEPPAQIIEVGHCDVVLIDGSWRVRAPVGVLHGVDRIDVETRAVHHISPSAVDGLPPFDASAFLDKARSEGVGALAAHRSDFEGRWLNQSLSGVPLFCTHKAALRVWPEAPAHNNQVLRYWLEEKGETSPDPVLSQPAHRAAPDAYVTAHTLRAMLAAGTAIADMIAWTAEPAALPRIPIGKQRGARWAEVEGGFLSWMLTKPDMDPDLKWLARRELARRAAK